MQITIGIGSNTNRNNSVSEYLKKFFKDAVKNIYITSFKKHLYQELKNKGRKEPLIVKNEDFYKINLPEGGQVGYHKDSVKNLDKIFTKRNITKYIGMNEEDPEMIDFWDKDFRSLFYHRQYWLNQVGRELFDIKPKENDVLQLVLIKDVEQADHHVFLKIMKSEYLKIVEYKKKGFAYEIPYPNVDLDSTQTPYQVHVFENDTYALQEMLKIIAYKLITNTIVNR